MSSETRRRDIAREDAKRDPTEVQVIEVIAVQTGRGRGTPDSPFRIVTSYWSRDGRKLAENDPLSEPEEPFLDE